MKTNIICKYWIIARSILVTVYYSLKTIWVTTFVKDVRVAVNSILYNWSKRLLKIVRVSYNIFDPHHIQFEPGKPYILMSNHGSHYDIPLIFVAVKDSVRMIAKKELFKVPLWGHAMQRGEFVAIDRNNRKQAIRDLRAAKEKMQSGIIIWVAPEGTRTRTGKMQQLKKGGFMIALQTGATIVPIGIRGSYNILPPKSLDFSLKEKVEIHIGAPIDTTGYRSKDVAKLMAEVEASIKALANQE